MNQNFSIGLWSLDASGYWGNTAEDTVAKIRAASKIEHIKGIEVIYPTHVNERNIKEVRKAAEDAHLTVISVNPNIWTDREFQKGALTSPDAATRRKALDYGKRSIDIAKEFGAGLMVLWPGQDGFDYPFQHDYLELWHRELEGVKEIAAYGKGHRIAVEYKAREPRGRSVVDSLSSGLLLAGQSGLDNVGVNLDFGHALMSRENPGESVQKAMAMKRLFGIHFNDNYGQTDEDMTFLSVHHIEALEFLYYLEKTAYAGWISVDIAPRREDAVEACSLCFRNLLRLGHALERIDEHALAEARAAGDALRSQELVSAAIFG